MVTPVRAAHTSPSVPETSSHRRRLRRFPFGGSEHAYNALGISGAAVLPLNPRRPRPTNLEHALLQVNTSILDQSSSHLKF